MYKILNGILLVHQTRQDAELDYWRIVVPDNKEIRDKVVQELHSIPYSAHPGIQRTIGKVRKSFFWKGMSGKCKRVCRKLPSMSNGKI